MAKAVPRFKNVSPLGALDVPALGRVIAAGEEFEVREDLVPLIAGQVANFEAVNAAAEKAAEAASVAPAGEDGTSIEDASSAATGEVVNGDNAA